MSALLIVLSTFHLDMNMMIPETVRLNAKSLLSIKTFFSRYYCPTTIIVEIMIIKTINLNVIANHFLNSNIKNLALSMRKKYSVLWYYMWHHSKFDNFCMSICFVELCFNNCPCYLLHSSLAYSLLNWDAFVLSILWHCNCKSWNIIIQ